MHHTTDYTRDERKQVAYNKADRDYTALYDGQPIGVFARSSAAWSALDAHAHTLLTHQPTVAFTIPHVSEPLALFTPSGPVSHVAISDAALDEALRRYCDVYLDPKLQQRAKRAHEAARSRHRWTVPSDGVLHLAGSKGDPYIVRDVLLGDDTLRECVFVKTDPATGESREQPCPDHTYRAHQNGAQCYHIITRELIRLAQHLDNGTSPEQTVPTAPDSAFVTINGRLLGLAFSIAYLSEGDVTVRIQQHTLQLATGIPCQHALTLQCADGHGRAGLHLDAGALDQLWTTFRPHATKLDTLQVFIDLDTRTLVLAAATFSANATGVPLMRSESW